MRRLALVALLTLATSASAQVVGDLEGRDGPLSSIGVGVLSLPLSANGDMFEEDAGTVTHVTWNGSALVDSKGNAWTQNGTVPQVAANVSPFVPGKPGAGVFSDANYYAGGTAIGEWTGDWSVTGVVNFSGLAGVQVFASKGNATSGWACYSAGTSGGIFVYDGASRTAGTAANTLVVGPNVITCGKSGGTCYVKVNGAVTASVACGAMTSSAASEVRIGRAGVAAQSVGGVIYEIIASTTPYSDALHLQRLQRAFGMLGTMNEPISVTRATPSTYEANGFIWNAPQNVLRIESNGALVESARTNQLLNSEDMTAATWVTTGTCTITANQGPVGWTSMDSIDCTGSTTANRGTTAIAGLSGQVGPVTGCMWVAAVSGTTNATLTIFAGSQIINGATCVRSDGGTCTVSGSGTNVPFAFGSYGTTPVRVCITGTAAAAPTSWQFSAFDGIRNTSEGAAIVAGYWTAEVGPYATSYIPTTSAAVARNADQVTVPAPVLSITDWTVSGDFMPYLGRAWSQASQQTLWALGTHTAANTALLWQDSTGVFAVTYDSAAAFKYVSAVSSGFTVGSHRLSSVNARGTLSLIRDGTSIGGAPVGAGTGLWTANPTTFYVGNRNAGDRAWDGWIKNLKLCRSSVLARCK